MKKLEFRTVNMGFLQELMPTFPGYWITKMGRIYRIKRSRGKVTFRHLKEFKRYDRRRGDSVFCVHAVDRSGKSHHIVPAKILEALTWD